MCIRDRPATERENSNGSTLQRTSLFDIINERNGGRIIYVFEQGRKIYKTRFEHLFALAGQIHNAVQKASDFESAGAVFVPLCLYASPGWRDRRG